MAYNLCEESIFEIFTRLPPKSLFRFRSLSKSWYSCISSPDFIRIHTLRSPQKILIRHREIESAEDFCTLHSEDQLPLCLRRGYFGIAPVRFPDKSSFDIVGSCKGILCLYDNDKQTISLWNPSIRRKLTLTYYPPRYISGVCFGFGFDPISDDYKIVNVYDSRYGQYHAASSFVYSMKTGTWCAIASPPPFNQRYVKSKACFVNGTLHWVVRCGLASRDNVVDLSIMTFNLSNNVFGMIELPRPTLESIKLTIIQDSLAVVSMELGDCLIWVRKDASWSVYSKLKTNQVNGKIMNVLQPSSNGDLLFHSKNEGIQVYNRKLRNVQQRLLDFSGCMVEMELCSESFGLLDMGTACKGN